MSVAYPAKRRRTSVDLTEDTFGDLTRLRAEAGTPNQDVMEALVRAVAADPVVRRRVVKLAREIRQAALQRRRRARV